MSLKGKTVLVTGAARRIGRALALAVAGAGGDVVLHHGHSPEAAEETRAQIQAQGGKAYVLQADLSDTKQAAVLVERASAHTPLYALVNNAAIFESYTWANTDLPTWQKHLDINLTAPFLLSQAFARAFKSSEPAGETGRIVNILDWRALRPGADHLPYTISKAALAALTRSLAIALAPQVTVNGLALGAILPPSDGPVGKDFETRLLANVPAGRWAELDEVAQALLFLLDAPAYITGEIIHVDGGRHLV